MIQFVKYETGHEPAVAALNERLRLGGSAFQFFPTAASLWPAERGRGLITQEKFLAVEGSEVRGGYGVTQQDFSFYGEVRRIAHIDLPLSEGAVNKDYNLLIVQLLQDARRRYPCIYGSGMGGRDKAMARVFARLRWDIFETPFLFRVEKGREFLLNLQLLRRSRWRRWGANCLAYSGGGGLLARAWRSLRVRSNPERAQAHAEIVTEFGGWADEIWSDNVPRLAMSAVRDAKHLKVLYPDANRKLHRLKISLRDRVVGWAVMLCTDMGTTQSSQYFGQMRVGTIVDCLATQGAENVVVGLAADYLRAQGADLVITNQSLQCWMDALKHQGFLQGPSNYLFSGAPALAALVEPLAANCRKIHYNRGDGDGPIHL